MSVDTVSDFVFRDKLSELDLKPYWERYRGYFFAVTVASSLGMVYILTNGITLDCLPRTNDTEILDGYSEGTESFVESVCLSDAYYFVVVSAIIALYDCWGILYYNKRRHHDKGVSRSLETYSRFKSAIAKLDLPLEKLKALSTCPCYGELGNKERKKERRKKEILKVRKACNILWDFDMNFSIKERHRSGNRYLLSILVVGLVYAAFMLWFSFQDRELFCVIPQDSTPAMICEEYDCVWRIPNLMFIMWLGFFISTVGQTICVTLASTKARKINIPSKTLTLEFLCFVKEMWVNNKEGISTCFDQFFDFIAMDAAGLLRTQFLENPLSIDAYLIKIFTKLSCDSKITAGIIYYQITKIEFTCKCEDYKTIVKIVKNIRELKWSDEVKILLDYCYNQRYFELLAAFLSIESEELGRHLNEYSSNLNQNLIGQPYEKGASLLHYVIGRERYDDKDLTVNDRIFKAFGKRPIVHYGGVSRAILRPSFWSSFSRNTKHDSSVNFQEIELILQNRNGRSWSDMAKEISRFKFKPWNEGINESAKYICRLKQWEVLVALMNAFIIEENLVQDGTTDRVVPGCHLDLSQAVNPGKKLRDPELPNSLLYFAFTKRDYVPFSLTAAATILHLTGGQERYVRGEAGSGFFYEKANDFIMERSNLLLHQKLELGKLLNIPGSNESARGWFNNFGNF